MKGHLLMSSKERRRKSVFDEVREGRISIKEAARLVNLGYRQCRRSYKRFLEEGDAGLVHRSRGRVSNRSKSDSFKQKVLKRYEERYMGFGPTLATEKLEKEGLVVDHDTLRRWLLETKLMEPKRRRKAYRSRRERKPHFGQLVQVDGSHHRWFGEDGPETCLVNMVDDATGVTMSFMAEEETTVACMKQLWQWIDNYGVPQALYTDKKNVFITSREPTIEEQLEDIAPKTAFGKACEKLGIEIIAANSPQAKGRVERNHGVYQDRFVKELRLRRVTTITGANKVLADGFIDELNRKFSIEPASQADFHCPVPKGLDLADVFCFEDQRVVSNDWTVRHKNVHYQIEQGNSQHPQPKGKVIVRTRLDGTIHLLFNNKPLKYKKLTSKDLQRRTARRMNKPVSTPKIVPFKRKNNGSHTPWREGVSLMFADTKKKKE